MKSLLQVFDDEWKELTRTVEIEKEWTKRYDFILFSPNVYKPLRILFILLTLQQLTFLPSFLTHTLEVLSNINPPSTLVTDIYSTSTIGFCRLLVNIISCIMFLKVGRRTFLVVSSVGMTVTSILLLILLQFNLLGHFGWNKIVVFTAFVMFGSAGVMTIPWSLTVELLPHGARGVGGTIATFYGNLLLCLLDSALPSILNTFTASLLFTFIAAASAILSAVCYKWVPETFDRSFGEIQLNFMK